MRISINQTAEIYDEREQSYGWFSKNMEAKNINIY